MSEIVGKPKDKRKPRTPQYIHRLTINLRAYHLSG